MRDYIMGRVRCIKTKADAISLGWKAGKNLVKKSKVCWKSQKAVRF